MSDFRTVTRFFQQIVIAYRYVQNQFNIFVDPFTEKERFHGYFHLNGAILHTATTILSPVLETFGEVKAISKSNKISCPRRHLISSPVIYFLSGKLKGQVYSSDPHTLDGLQQNIGNVIAALHKLRASHSLINRVQRCIDINVDHLHIFYNGQCFCSLIKGEFRVNLINIFWQSFIFHHPARRINKNLFWLKNSKLTAILLDMGNLYPTLFC
ncbi:hypothetical protein NPIL_212921 [Nephila pilipes]|uniref:Uncharacterized protein n=1 Tax=Nephila pilipes TaxID=299642 RepID=A0A8X6QJJ7_NEPPI|nr:hypothetical protein NPIL_212921 [Nephila pilipes]